MNYNIAMALVGGTDHSPNIPLESTGSGRGEDGSYHARMSPGSVGGSSTAPPFESLGSGAEAAAEGK